MTISNLQNQSSTPVGATTLVFSGNSSLGDYEYTTSLPAGNYIIQARNSYNNSTYITLQNNQNVLTTLEGLAYFKTTAASTSLKIVTPLRPIAVSTSSNLQAYPYISDGTLMWGGVVGTGNFYVSTDGITWTTRGITESTAIIAGIAYSAAAPFKYTAISSLPSPGRLYQSTDGITWTTANSVPLTSTLSSAQPTGVVTNNSVTRKYLVWTGAGPMSTSADGVNWSGYNTGGAYYNIATFGTAITCAYVGANSSSNATAVVTSTDGITWSTRNTGLSGNYVAKVKAVNNLYWAFSNQGPVGFSTDGITWTVSGINGNDVTHVSGSGYYVSNTQISPTAAQASTALYFSTNGTTWSAKPASAASGTQFQNIITHLNKPVTFGSFTYQQQSSDVSQISLYNAVSTTLN